MLRSLILRTVFGICLGFSCAAAFADESFSNVYIFGDSLSDTGNLASLPDFAFLNDPNLPYDKGFSNGPRAVQVLATTLGLSAEPSLHLIGPVTGTNFAVAGASARGDAAIDLKTQIDAFLLDTAGVAPSDALYIILIGGKDIADARDERRSSVAADIISDAAAAIGTAVRTLAGAGARSMLVTNSAGVGNTPETRTLAELNDDPSLIRRARRQTHQFNAALSRRLRRIERRLDIDIVKFDLYRFFASIRSDAMALGFTNPDGACFSSVSFTFNPDCESGANFDKFIFFDELHPSARVHERAARALFALVPVHLADPQ